MQAHLNPVANTTTPTRRKKLIPAAGMDEPIRRPPWTPDDDAALREMVEEGYTDAEIGVALDRSRPSIYERRKALGIAAAMTSSSAWTDDEIATIKALHAAGMTADDIADHLPGRSGHAVHHKLYKIGLKPHRSHGKRKVKLDKDEVRRMFERGMSVDDVVRATGAGKGAVRGMHHRMGFHQARRGGTMRHCLTCRQQFVSEGPHNRMCVECRETYSSSPFDCDMSLTISVAA